MKIGLTTITRGMVYLMTLAVISICGVLLPELAREEAVGKASPPQAYPFLIGAWILTIPIFIALLQVLKLLKYIDQNQAFSDLSVKALRNTKYCSIAFSVLIALAIATVIIVARIADPTEDVTGFITLGFIFAVISSVIATFIAILQRLLQEAIHMKKENDLII